MTAKIPSVFDRWDLDPREGPSAITERMRELAEDEPDADRRAAIRADWEALTRHPLRRLDEALETFPETRIAIAGGPPRAEPPRAGKTVAHEPPLDLCDLVPVPRLGSALPDPDEAERAILGPPRAASVVGG